MGISYTGRGVLHGPKHTHRPLSSDCGQVRCNPRGRRNCGRFTCVGIYCEIWIILGRHDRDWSNYPFIFMLLSILFINFTIILKFAMFECAYLMSPGFAKHKIRYLHKISAFWEIDGLRPCDTNTTCQTIIIFPSSVLWNPRHDSVIRKCYLSELEWTFSRHLQFKFRHASIKSV